MSEIQEQIQRYLDTLACTGAETGVQVAVYQDGALIVDAVAGTADPATGRPVASGTPIFSFSTGKNVAATLAHLLVARGFLDYDSPVTDLWPGRGRKLRLRGPRAGGRLRADENPARPELRYRAVGHHDPGRLSRPDPLSFPADAPGRNSGRSQGENHVRS